MPDKDDLDLLLDSALATYADPGPDSGLEQRVLSALEVERNAGERLRPATKMLRWLPWAIAVPLAASLLLWIGVEQFKSPHSIQQRQASQGHPSLSSHDSQVATDSQPPVPPAVKGHDSDRGLKGHEFSRAVVGPPSRRALAPEGRLLTARLGNSAPLPKLAVFPSPQPLTSEEQALVAATTRSSEAQRTALLEAAKPPSDVPLAIADLTIPPLVPLDEGKK